MITTPPNMPRIADVIKFWPYRHFFDRAKREAAGIGGPLTVMFTGGYGCEEPQTQALESLREALAAITSPSMPLNHIDNHSGWEVRLKNNTRAFVLFTDGRCYMYQLP